MSFSGNDYCRLEFSSKKIKCDSCDHALNATCAQEACIQIDGVGCLAWILRLSGSDTLIKVWKFMKHINWKG